MKAVGAFDGPVLVGNAQIVAGRRHAVAPHERFVPLGQVLLSASVQIAKRRRQAVAAMLVGRAAERPKRILQAFGQRHEAFAADNHMEPEKASRKW